MMTIKQEVTNNKVSKVVEIYDDNKAGRQQQQGQLRS